MTRKRLMLTVLVVVLLLGSGFVALVWPRPADREIEGGHRLFQGVTYLKLAQEQPRPATLHIVEIDLNNDHLHFFVTPRAMSDGDAYLAQTTSAFAETQDLQVAINGDFFQPWHDRVLSYYPHTGDPVDTAGIAVSAGEVVTPGYAPPGRYATLYLTEDNQATFTAPAADAIYNAISGWGLILRDGRLMPMQSDDPMVTTPLPRTVIALDTHRDVLMLVVVDGRQPGISEGMTLPELARVIRDQGANTALLMDGGGSSTLVIAGEDGHPVVINSPVHNLVPGRERPVANHLGIWITPVPGTAAAGQ